MGQHSKQRTSQYSLYISVQVQTLELLKDLQRIFNLTYMFIPHDISVVKYMSSGMAVMYLGKIVEVGPADSVFEDPDHSYAKFLLTSVPIPDPKTARSRTRVPIKGEPPSPMNPPPGCRFHPRCPHTMETNSKKEPPAIEVESNHVVYCWLYSKSKLFATSAPGIARCLHDFNT